MEGNVFMERTGYPLAGGVGGDAARPHGGREGEAPRGFATGGGDVSPLRIAQ